MLLNLHVKNLAIIDEAEVDFQKGLNVLTGETGAGKSIIIGSISTALGGKVNGSMIRSGAEYALAELTFLVEKKEQQEKLKEMGIFLEEDNTLLISRKIMEKRTVNRVNGETVTVAQIKEMAEILIDIHGQNEQQSLLRKNKHREILDEYAGDRLKDVMDELEAAYRRYQQVCGELSEKELPEEERLREISFLEYELSEIEGAALVSGEEAELEERFKKLSNSEKIAEGLSEIYRETSQSDGSVSEQISSAVRILTGLTGYDEALSGFLDQLSDIDALVTDFNRELSAYMDEFETGGEELSKVEKRLDLVRSLKAKYGATTEEVLAYAEKNRQKLSYYEQYEEHRDKLLEEKEALCGKLKEISAQVTKIRKECADVLEKEITQALLDLNFLQVRFEIRITNKETFSANGMDEIEFMISTNPGEELRSLGDVASGGELSRIMLAIKTVFVEHDEIPTMIFDEIDVGISGRTAQMVAEKMAVIGKSHQVICISHLAQIAAMADTHFVIEKENTDGHTSTGIRRLSDEESVTELARILGGAKITDAVTGSAREMKELARQVKGK